MRSPLTINPSSNTCTSGGVESQRLFTEAVPIPDGRRTGCRGPFAVLPVPEEVKPAPLHTTDAREVLQYVITCQNMYVICRQHSDSLLDIS